jgi:predicted transcriptional regulator
MSKEMVCGLYKFNAEQAKPHGMTKEQCKCEIQYKMALKMLNVLLRRGVVTEEEYRKIDSLNRQSFSPQLARLYA